MYDEFYGFSHAAFGLSPDIRFIYRHPSFARATAYLHYALYRGEGFVMITGSPGTGKTTLVQDLLGELGDSGHPVASVDSTQVDADDLLRLVVYSFGMKASGLDKATLLHELKRFLLEHTTPQRRAIIIIDEAQNLPVPSLEELRLITNLQRDAQPLLQIFLVGQEALRDTVRQPELEQLHQRIIAACHLELLDLQETRNYIEHRLLRAGWIGDPVFEAEAIARVHAASGGVPRLVNKICDRLLLYGSLEERHRLTAEEARVVLADLREEFLDRDDDVVGSDWESIGDLVYSGAPGDGPAVEAPDPGAAAAHAAQPQAHDPGGSEIARPAHGGDEGAVDGFGPPGTGAAAPLPASESAAAVYGQVGTEGSEVAEAVRPGEPLAPAFSTAPATPSEYASRPGREDDPSSPGAPGPAVPQPWGTASTEQAEHRRQAGVRAPVPAWSREDPLRPHGGRRRRFWRYAAAAAVLSASAIGGYLYYVRTGSQGAEVSAPSLAALLDRASGFLGAQVAGLRERFSPAESESTAQDARGDGLPAREPGDSAPERTAGPGASQALDSAAPAQTAAREGARPEGPGATSESVSVNATARQAGGAVLPDVRDPEEDRATESPAQGDYSAVAETQDGEPVPIADGLIGAGSGTAQAGLGIEAVREGFGGTSAVEPASPGGSSAGVGDSDHAGDVGSGDPVDELSAVAMELRALGLTPRDVAGGGVAVDLADELRFAFNSAEIPRESQGILDELAQIFGRHGGYDLTIVGHTDAAGPSAYNQALSLRRARSVERYLRAGGVDGERISSEGRGEAEAAMSPPRGGLTHAPTHLRRIEILLQPREEL